MQYLTKIKIILLFPVLFIAVSCDSQTQSKSFMKNSTRFIKADNKVLYWNIYKPLKITINGSTNTYFYRAALRHNGQEKNLTAAVRQRTDKEINAEVSFPQGLSYNPLYPVDLKVFTNGDHNLYSEFRIRIDTNNPRVNLLRYSPEIARGGCAVAILQVKDESAVAVKVKVKNGRTYFGQEYGMSRIYAVLFTWELTGPAFKADIEVTDRAGNQTVIPLPITTRETKYPVTVINVGDSFLEDKKKELVPDRKDLPKDAMKQYDLLVKNLYSRTTVSLTELGSRVKSNFLTNLSVNTAFNPLKRYKISSEYGLFRIFKFKGEVVRQNYHMGLDLFDLPKSEIFSHNPGRVVYAGYNGAAGNVMMIDHGLGLYSIYMHCTEFFFKEGDIVKAGDRIALSGTTGYSTGDHLHFGMMLQGVYVNPHEWMNSAWIRNQIRQVIDDALFLHMNGAGL